LWKQAGEMHLGDRLRRRDVIVSGHRWKTRERERGDHKSGGTAQRDGASMCRPLLRQRWALRDVRNLARDEGLNGSCRDWIGWRRDWIGWRLDSIG
jgi:hypothetical protein